jgi:dimethylglycine dehydrogenase
MIFSPDLSPLVGPHPALRNYYCANGVMSGFNQGGGVGRILSEWILDGEPSMDVHFWDVARFGDWAGPDYAAARARYGYEHRQKVHYPFEEVDVGRGLLTSAIHGRLKAEGAVHGQVFGMEHPLWYAPEGTEPCDRYDFLRGNWFEAVGEECRAVRGNVGFLDVTAFAKYRVTGSGAEGWLDRLCANRLPREGRTTLSPMLSPHGRMIADFTVTRLEDAFLLFGSGIMQESHMRWFRKNLPSDGSVTVENLTRAQGGIHIAGPRSRELLQSLTNANFGPDAFPFLGARRLDIDGCRGVTALRVSFTGELGYELYCPAADHAALYDMVIGAGESFGLRHAGGRAMASMRIEKAFPSWGIELSPDYSAAASGLDRFIRPEKGEFVGREAFLRQQEDAPRTRLRQFTVAARERECFGGEAIYAEGRFCGHVTSAAFGHATSQSLALGYVDATLGPDTEFEIDLLGERVAARIAPRPVYDPNGERMRA